MAGSTLIPLPICGNLRTTSGFSWLRPCGHAARACKPRPPPFCKSRAPGQITRTMFRLSTLPALLLATSLVLGFGPAAPAQNAAPAEVTAADILHAVREAQAGRHEALAGTVARRFSTTRSFPSGSWPMARWSATSSRANRLWTVQVRYNADKLHAGGIRRGWRQNDPGEFRQENPRHGPDLRGPVRCGSSIGRVRPLRGKSG